MKPIDYEKLYRIPRSDIEQMLREEFHGVTIRTYVGGNSYDEKREATEAEMDLYMKIGLSTICCARYVKDIQHCTDTAEWIFDEFIENCNGYDTIYCPIKRVWNRMVKLTEEMED